MTTASDVSTCQGSSDNRTIMLERMSQQRLWVTLIPGYRRTVSNYFRRKSRLKSNSLCEKQNKKKDTRGRRDQQDCETALQSREELISGISIEAHPCCRLYRSRPEPRLGLQGARRGTRQRRLEQHPSSHAQRDWSRQHHPERRIVRDHGTA